ncbi:MAG: beta strand repeat-containing protein, partial [Dehalococcoidia bacterium]
MTSVTLNAATAGATSNLSIDMQMDSDINPGETITITFPADSTPAATGTPWQVPTSADLSGSVSWAGLTDPAPAITSNAGARTITTTVAILQPAGLPLTITIGAGAGLTNPAAAGTYRVDVTATNNAPAQSGDITILPAATAVTGVTISAAPLTEHTASTVTVAFTPSATGALGVGNTITVTMTGYTFAPGPIAVTPTGGFVGATLNGAGAGGNTVTVTVAAGSLAALTQGTFTFPATNPGPGAIAAAGLTLATSQDTTAVQSAAGITITATAVTGVTISAAPLTATSASTITVGFTPTATGALTTGDTITVTMTGYTFAAGPIAITPTGGFVGAALAGAGAGGNTVTVTVGGGTSLAASTPATFTFPATNPGAGAIAAVALTVRTSKNTTDVASAAGFTIVPGATAVTGVTISASPLTEAVASTVTVAFTPSAAGALAAGNTVTVTMTGYTLTNGAIALTTTGGFVGALTGNVTGGNTVTATLAGGASLAALTQGTFTFPATNPAAGTLAAAGLTVATSQDTSVVQSSAGITIAAASTPDDGGGGGGFNPFLPPVTCQAGSYNEGGSCVPAPAGHFVALSGATSPTACRPGEYQPNEGMLFCFQVPAGSFTSVSGAIAATQWKVCPTGQAVVTEGTATTDRVCGDSPRPTIKALALVPLNSAGTLDDNVLLSDWPRADLTGGQTTFTLPVSSGRSYGVAAEATSGTITYRRGGIPFTPSTTQLTAGDTVTVQAVNDAGTSPTYTLTLSGGLVCLNGGIASGGSCICVNGYTGSQCEIPPTPVITNGAITLSSNAASATAVTATVTFTTPVSIPIGGKIKVEMSGFSWPATPAAQFVSGAGVTTVGSASFASNVLTVTTSTAAIGANSSVVLTVTGATNPSAAQAARTDVAMSVTNAADSVLASTSTATMVAITSGIPQLTNGAITLSSNAASATAVTPRITFTSPVAIPAGGKIKVTLTGFAWPATPVATFTAPSPAANTAAFTSNVLTVTTPSGISAGTVTFGVTGATNPSAAQAASTTVRIEVTNSADTTLASTSTATMPAIVGGTAITAVNISANPLAANAATTITVNARYTTALVAADRITVKMAGYTFPVGSVAVTGGTGVTGTLTGTVSPGATDTVVITGAAITAGATATFTFPATNPAAGTIAKAGLTVATSKDTTAVASAADIVVTAPAGLRDVRFSVADPSPNARTALTVEFTPGVALATGNEIRVNTTDFIVPTSGVSVTTSTGFSTGATFSVFTGFVGEIRVTVTGTAASNTPLSVTLSPVTNPQAAKTIRKPGLTVATTPETTAVASSADIVIAAPAGIRDVSFRPSSTVPGARVDLEVTFTPATALAGGSDNILFSLGDWLIPSSGVPASVTQPGSASFDTSGSLSGGLLSLTIPSGSSVQANQPVTVRLQGFTNPSAKTIAKAGL